MEQPVKSRFYFNHSQNRDTGNKKIPFPGGLYQECIERLINSRQEENLIDR